LLSFAEFLRLDLGKNIFCGFIKGLSLDVEHDKHAQPTRAVLVCTYRVQSAPFVKYDVYMNCLYNSGVAKIENFHSRQKRQREDHCKLCAWCAARCHGLVVMAFVARGD